MCRPTTPPSQEKKCEERMADLVELVGLNRLGDPQPSEWLDRSRFQEHRQLGGERLVDDRVFGLGYRDSRYLTGDRELHELCAGNQHGEVRLPRSLDVDVRAVSAESVFVRLGNGCDRGGQSHVDRHRAVIQQRLALPGDHERIRGGQQSRGRQTASDRVVKPGAGRHE